MNAHAFGSDQLTEGWLVKEAVGKTGMWCVVAGRLRDAD